MLVTDVGGLAEIAPNNKVGYVTSQTAIFDAIVDFYKSKEFSKNTAEKEEILWSSFVNGIDQLIKTVKNKTYFYFILSKTIE